MQPNQASTPWGAFSTIVTVFTVLVGIWLGFATLSVLPSASVSSSDFALSHHVCTTVTNEKLYDNEDAFGDPDTDGVRSAPATTAFCKPLSAFEHPVVARLLVAAQVWSLAIPALGLLLGVRRIIRRTRDEGPFSAEAVRLLRRSFRWIFVAFAAAGLAHWVVQGLTNDLVADAGWPDLPSIWPAVGALAAVSIFVGFCESGVRQTQGAYERGLAAQPPAERPVD